MADDRRSRTFLIIAGHQHGGSVILFVSLYPLPLVKRNFEFNLR